MARCRPCMAPQVKEQLAKSYPDLKPALRGVQDCRGAELMELCAAGGGKGGKRVPSAYNAFISACLKGKRLDSFEKAPEAMRTCAQEWRRQKKS